MKYEFIKVEPLSVKGNAIKTSNSENKFNEVWQSFFATYSGGQPIAVYTDYESDYKGKFTFIVGVSSPKTEESFNYDGGKYIKFHLKDRNLLLQCWQYIWQNDFDRAYTADFEIYYQDNSVDVLIAVNN